MRRTLGLFVVLSVVVVGCGTTSRIGAPDASGAEVAVWHLDSGTVDGADLVILDDHPITMTLDGERIVGNATCNTYSGSYQIDDGVFALTGPGVAVTEMWCGDEQGEAEQAYLNALLRVDSATVTDSGLVLSGDGVELRFVRHSDLPPPDPNASEDPDEPVSSEDPDEPASGEDTPGEPSEDPGEPVSSTMEIPETAHGDWVLVSGENAGGRIPILPDYPFTLSITADRISGQACNGFTVIFQENEEAEIMTQLTSCGEEVDAVETTFYNALRQVEAMTINNGQLVMRLPNGVLTFAPAD